MLNGVKIINGVAPWLHGGTVKDLNEHTATLNMAQELQTQSLA